MSYCKLITIFFPNLCCQEYNASSNYKLFFHVLLTLINENRKYNDYNFVKQKKNSQMNLETIMNEKKTIQPVQRK
jgi:hypothetical protein